MGAVWAWLFELRGRHTYMYLDREDRPAAVGHFEVLLQRLRRYRSAGALVGRAVVIWVIVLLALYLVLAYRPDFNAAPAGDRTVQNVERHELNRQSVSGGTAFREYLARMAGTIPQECAVAERNLTLPVEPKTSEDDQFRPGTAFLVDLFKIGHNDVATTSDGTYYLACGWRSRFESLLAAVSLDVGLVQKVTLLFLIIGLLWLQRSLLQVQIDRAAFPRGNPGLETELPPELYQKWTERRLGTTNLNQDDLDRGEHPISIINRRKSQDVQRRPLYPVTYLGLDAEHEQNSEVRLYRERVERIRASMESSGQTEPFDLILDVLERGASTGKAGEAGNRLRIAVFEYSDRLAGRLWPAEYILWLLPTIGFLGTIYGISASLVRAKDLFSNQDDNSENFAANIQTVVDGLGVAFDTTSLALICATFLYLSLCSVRQRIAQLAESARKTLQTLLVGRMVDRDEIPRKGHGRHVADTATVPHGGIDNAASED